MKMFKRVLGGMGIAVLLGGMLSGCSSGHPTAKNPGEASTVTNMAYNTQDGFQVEPFQGQPTGPNLVYIEGGRSVLGTGKEDVLGRHNNVERTVTVASFYMDQTEIANIHWLEYLFYVKRDSSEEFYKSALPDTTVWHDKLSYNDPYVDHYLRYPGFRYFPVVGVSWEQAVDYCKWRTRVVNRQLAKQAGMEVPEGERIPLESGHVLPDYRLPSEAEWEYAAKALIGTQWLDENQTHQRIYPWDGHSLRNPYGKNMGEFLANFKRGRGDYAGIAGKLNDGAMITDYIYAYPPNDYGLYNMAGNVNEWVYDVFRPLNFQKMNDLNPLRREVYDVFRPLNFQKMNDLNPLRRDGYLDPESNYDKAGFQSMIDNESRVYKGGSWKDPPYWLSPGTRRYLQQDSSTATIGFRCAMIRAGSNK